jgi:hypothetical protein
MSHLDEIHAIDGVQQSGMGSCCEGWEEHSSECLELGVRRFGANRPELRDALRTIQLSDPKFADRELQVSVELMGRHGPRCAPGKCGPLPYRSLGHEQTPPATSTAARVPIGNQMESAACQHDGECLVSGCWCVHWTAGDISCAGVGGGEEEKSFCGCVDSRCALFL